jgi:hypothetical protein
MEKTMHNGDPSETLYATYLRNAIVLLLLLIFLLQGPVFSQHQVSEQIYGFNMPVELDRDTLYHFILDNKKCTVSLLWVPEQGGCNYMENYPHLYFSHQVAFNCCTDHYYKIKVHGDSITISHTETGENCLCGWCVYVLTFSDQNPQKDKYHLYIAGKDTTVTKSSRTREELLWDDIDIFYNRDESKIVVENKMPGGDAVTISLFDISGKEILQKQIHGHMELIEAGKLQTGVYIIQVKKGTHWNSRKLAIYKK